MKTQIERIVENCQELVKRGASSSDLIIYLHQLEITIVESMKVLMEVYGLSLGEAKRLTSAHPVWKEVVAATAPLHDEIEQEIKKEGPSDNG